jgi:hypothetical protein
MGLNDSRGMKGVNGSCGVNGVMGTRGFMGGVAIGWNGLSGMKMNPNRSDEC